MTPRRSYGSGSIREVRPGVYRVSVSAGRDPLTGKPRRASRNVRNRRDAEKALRALVREVEAGRDVDGARKPLGDVLDEWLAFRRPHIGRVTYDKYETIVRRHITPHLGARSLACLTARDVDRWMVAMLNSDPPTRASTVRDRHAVLRACLTQAMKWGYVERNVASLATPPPSDTAEVRPATVGEVKVLLAAAEEWSPSFAVLLWVVANTGLRRGEACGLRWSDVGWDTATLTVARSIGLSHGEVFVKEPKTRASRRRLALNLPTVGVLLRHREWVAKRAAEAGLKVYSDNAFLFSDRVDGAKPHKPTTVSWRFCHLARPLGLGHLHLHSLRHSVASILLAEGVPLRTVAGRLGHAQLATTSDRYGGHLLEDADRSAADVLGALLAGQQGTPPTGADGA